MAETTRPTDSPFQSDLLRLAAWFKKLLPSWKDPATPLTAFLAVALLLVIKTPVKHIGNPVPILAAIALVAVAGLGDWWEGRIRMAAATTAAIALGAIMVLEWRLTGWWLLVPLFLILWTPWAIGHGRGTRTRQVSKIRGALPSVMAAASPKTKNANGELVPLVKTGKVSANDFGHITAEYFVRDPKFNGSAFAHLVAVDLQVPTHLVTDVDLSHAVAAGKHKLTVRAYPAFAAEVPPMPKPADWPKGKIPLGWDADGQITWLPMLDSDAQHMLIGGTSGSGKSNFIRYLACTYRAIDWRVWGVDGSGGSLGIGPLCDEYYQRDEQGVILLDKAWQLMVEREGEIKPGGMHEGPGILVVIDESASVLKSKAAAFAAKEIAARGRKARIALVLGLQSAYVDSAGGGETLANLPTRIGFRTMSEKYNRMIVIDNQEGFLTHEIAREARGECVVRGMPQADWAKMRTWEVIDLPSTPSTGVRTNAPTQGVQGVDGLNVQNGQGGELNGQTEGRQYKWDDRIEGALHHLPRSMSDIADALGCPKATCQASLKRLETRGKAARRPDGWVNPILADLSLDPD